jgi:GNAT superfamily N-acetyltransferase
LSAGCTFLPWDTDFFGQRIGRIDAAQPSEAQMEAIESWCAKERIACLYHQVNAADIPGVRLAEGRGFQLMEVRLFMEARLDAAALAPALPDGVTIRPTLPSDLAALQSLAAVSYPFTRYHADPHFAPAAAAYYGVWVKNSLEGLSNFHLAAEKDNRLMGFISGQAHPTESGEEVFELMAVDPAVRQGGIGRALLIAGMEWCRRNGRLRITFATQGGNIALQRAVQRLGFLSLKCTLYYHRWFI